MKTSGEEILVTDSQEIKAICDYYGIPVLDITGALVIVGDGEYESAKFTIDSRPYLINAKYSDISFFVCYNTFYMSPESTGNTYEYCFMHFPL
jgi:hypothetical protein